MGEEGTPWPRGERQKMQLIGFRVQTATPHKASPNVDEVQKIKNEQEKVTADSRSVNGSRCGEMEERLPQDAVNLFDEDFVWKR